MSDDSTAEPLTRRARREAGLAGVTPAEASAAVSTAIDTAPADLRASGPAAAVVDSALDSYAPDSAGGSDEAPAAQARRNPVASVLRAIGTGLMAGLLLLLLAIAALAIVVPAATGSTALTVMTSSMEPVYPPGTMVVVRPTPAADIMPGDVLTYQLHSGEPTLITHRVTQQLLAQDGSYSFITKGDNNPQADPDPVKEVQIKGTVWYAIPYLGWVSQAVTGDGRAMVIPVLVVALFGYAVWMIVSSIRDRARRRRSSASL